MKYVIVQAVAVMEGMNLGGPSVERAVRTTGANPGRRPRRLRFTLDKAGFIATPVWTDAHVDVLKLRERLNLTREKFALRYGVEVETLRNWEISKRAPDKAARSCRLAIWNAPEEVEAAYSPKPTVRLGQEAEESV